MVAFHFPLWSKAVDIITAKDLRVIPRLGGFHILKSILGWIGYLMSDSGLSEIINIIYPGTNTVANIMNGQCYQKAIRAHLLINATIFQHLMKGIVNDDGLAVLKSHIEYCKASKTGENIQAHA